MEVGDIGIINKFSRHRVRLNSINYEAGKREPWLTSVVVCFAFSVETLLSCAAIAEVLTSIQIIKEVSANVREQLRRMKVRLISLMAITRAALAAAFRAYIVAAAFVVFVSGCLLSPALADPKSDSIIRDKFRLVWAASSDEQTCSALRKDLNQPSIYDPTDLAKSLLIIRRAYLWRQRNTNGEWRPPVTFGAVFTHGALEDLLLDLDADGKTDRLVREWFEIKGQRYNRLSLSPELSGDVPASAPQLFSLQQVQRLLEEGATAELAPDSSYYLFEAIEADERSYVIALSTIWSGTETNDRLAYVFGFRPGPTPYLACAFQTLLFN